jgi:hypothetical protein
MKTLYIHGSADHYGSAKILLDILRLPGNAKDAIVVLPHDGLLVNDIKALDIPVHLINLGVLRRKYMTPWGMVGRLALWISAIVQLRKLIRDHQIDRVYVNSANVVVGPALKQKNQTELVWHLHEIVESPAILKSFLSYLIKQADKIIAVSAATKKFWDTAMRNEKVDLLYNGLHLEKFNNTTADKKSLFSLSNDETCLVGMVGRVQHWKGQHYFLVLVPAYLSVDLAKLGDLLGVNRLGFASAQRLMDYLGVQPGSVSVFGLINDHTQFVRCIIDQSLWNAEAIHAHPLVNTATMIVSHSNLNKFLALTGHTPQIISVPALGPQAIAA